MKSQVVSTRFPQDVYDWLAVKAEEEKISQGKLVSNLITQVKESPLPMRIPDDFVDELNEIRERVEALEA